MTEIPWLELLPAGDGPALTADVLALARNYGSQIGSALTLIVLGFPNMEAADESAPQLGVLNREGLIDLADWARVIRREEGRIDVHQGTSTTTVGAAGGALWGCCSDCSS